jgi:hypothetical protein
MKAQTNRRLRQFHHYLGVLFAPAIIFFAVSGAFQTFRWQEEKGYGGTPPQWIVWIASVHKDQAEPRVRPPEAARAAERPKAAANKPARKSALPLKIFVTAMSAGLALSALLGIVVALNIRSMRRVSLVMLGLGTLLPLVLLKL